MSFAAEALRAYLNVTPMTASLRHLGVPVGTPVPVEWSQSDGVARFDVTFKAATYTRIDEAVVLDGNTVVLRVVEDQVLNLPPEAEYRATFTIRGEDV